MSDFERIFAPRVEKAVKAISLLENGAAKRYEADGDTVRAYIRQLEDALDSVRSEYADHLGVTEKADETTTESVIEESEESPATRDSTNTSSSQPLVFPHWAQIKDFVSQVPKDQIPSYILHFGDRMYEDSYEMFKKTRA